MPVEATLMSRNAVSISVGATEAEVTPVVDEEVVVVVVGIKADMTPPPTQVYQGMYPPQVQMVIAQRKLLNTMRRTQPSFRSHRHPVAVDRAEGALAHVVTIDYEPQCLVRHRCWGIVTLPLSTQRTGTGRCAWLELTM